MLPAVHRLSDADAFRQATRQGRRASSPTLVLHLLGADPDPGGAEPIRVGFVVSRAIGGAVTRNRVKRRLRHLLRERLPQLPPSSVLVVRALPAAASAGTADLRGDLDRCLPRVSA